MINNILFDFDGTLADTAPGIVATFRESFIRMNRPVPTDEAIIATIGLPLRQAYQILGNMTEDEADKAFYVYVELFRDYELPNIRIFPGVDTLLRQFHEQGIRMAIVTSRDRDSLETILANNHIDSYFEHTLTNDDNVRPKPAPDMVLTLLERMHINNNETLVIGDTTFDIEMGNRAHCHTCAVTYGNHTEEQLRNVHPDAIIHHIEELSGVVGGK